MAESAPLSGTSRCWASLPQRLSPCNATVSTLCTLQLLGSSSACVQSMSPPSPQSRTPSALVCPRCLPSLQSPWGHIGRYLPSRCRGDLPAACLPLSVPGPCYAPSTGAGVGDRGKGPGSCCRAACSQRGKRAQTPVTVLEAWTKCHGNTRGEQVTLLPEREGDLGWAGGRKQQWRGRSAGAALHG